MWSFVSHLRQELNIFDIKLFHGIRICALCWELYFVRQFETVQFMNILMPFLRFRFMCRCNLYSIWRDFLILLMVVSYREEAFSTGLCPLFPEHSLHVNLTKDFIVTVFPGWTVLKLSSYNKQNKVVFLHKLKFL